MRYYVILNSAGLIVHRDISEKWTSACTMSHGTPAFLFRSRKDAQEALDQMPHGHAKACRIAEFSEVPQPA